MLQCWLIRFSILPSQTCSGFISQDSMSSSAWTFYQGSASLTKAIPVAPKSHCLRSYYWLWIAMGYGSCRYSVLSETLQTWPWKAGSPQQSSLFWYTATPSRKLSQFWCSTGFDALKRTSWRTCCEALSGRGPTTRNLQAFLPLIPKTVGIVNLVG